jgi:hypothetical protein
MSGGFFLIFVAGYYFKSYMIKHSINLIENAKIERELVSDNKTDSNYVEEG